MRTFTAGRYRFQGETVDRTDPGLPPTPDLLVLLSPEHTKAVGLPQTESATGTANAPESLRVLIERELAEFLGPMATLICAEHLAQADTERVELVDQPGMRQEAWLITHAGDGPSGTLAGPCDNQVAPQSAERP